MGQNNPDVSVIIPTYNSSATLKLALESVLMQDFQNFEVWVVGDGCTDESKEIVLSFGDNRINWTNLSSNSGAPSVPRNEGLRRAKGSYIAYLGHDDLWFPWHLSGLVRCIERNDADLSYSLGILLSPKGVMGTFSMPDCAWEGAISPSNWLHKKELIGLTGPWPEDAKISDDRIFLNRAQKRKAQSMFWKKLSVLKYPAMCWKTYSRTIDLPQERDLESMRQDSERFQLALLNDIGANVARNRISFNEPKRLIPKPMRGIFQFIIQVYGVHRWPINQILYWLYRKRSGLID